MRFSLDVILVLKFIFTALHRMQTRFSDEKSVCLSAVKRVICDKTKQSCASILIPCERTFTLVLWQEEWLVGATRSTWNFGPNWPCCSEIADFQSTFARSASAVKTIAKEVQLTIIGSPSRAFQWAQDEHHTLSLSPQRVAQKLEVSKIWTISRDNSETVRDRMSVTINH